MTAGPVWIAGTHFAKGQASQPPTQSEHAMKSGWGCALTALIVIVCGIAAVSLFEQAYRRMNEVAMERSRIRSEVGQIILAYYRDYDEPPSGLPDLEEYADEFPDGYRELSQGKWTVRWGLTLNKSHRFQGNWDRILAYKESEDASRSWTISAGGGGSIDDNEGLHKTIEASTIMHDIFDMYSAYIKEHGKPPLSKDDLKPYAEKHPKGYDAIGQDPWVVRWGTELSDDDIENSDIVLVYGKKVINDLGFALCADGVAYPVINDELPRWLEAGPIAHQIARMYFAYYKAHTKPPTRIEDLEPYEKTYPIGYQAAKSGAWVVVWGTEISRDRKTNWRRLLAYDRRVPFADNYYPYWALFADNSTCQVSAYEFSTKDWEKYEYRRIFRD